MWNITADPWGSHQPLLFKILEKYGEGELLELGCGNFSTPYMSKCGNLDVYSTDPEWGSKFEDIANITYLNSWDNFKVEKHYRIALQDSEQYVVDRIKKLPYLLTVADIVIMHDWRAGLKPPRCKYQGIYKGRTPWTWWGSNTINTTTEEILT